MGRAQWLAIRARKTRVPGLIPASSYVQRWTTCSDCPAIVSVSVKRVEVVVISTIKCIPFSPLSSDSYMFAEENP